MASEISFKVNASSDETSANANINEETYLIHFILWGVFLPLIAAMGIVGNILTIIVLWRKEMNSTTILYLRALVITDTGILIGSVITLTPISLANYLHGDLKVYKDAFYPLVHTPSYYIVMTLQAANVWIRVALSMERYISICHPFKADRLITRRKTYIVLVGISVCSILYNVPHLLATKAIDCSIASSSGDDPTVSIVSYSLNISTAIAHNVSDDTLMNNGVYSVMEKRMDINSSTNSTSRVRIAQSTCLLIRNTEFGDTTFYKSFRTIMYTVAIYVIPFGALVVLNSFLIKELMAMQKRRSGTNIQEENEANMSLVLVLIVVVFILCQTPGLISQFDVIPFEIFFIWLAVSNLLFATNSAVNFLIYTAFGRKFRSVLLKVFRHVFASSKRFSSTSLQSTHSAPHSDVLKSDPRLTSVIKKNGRLGVSSTVHENIPLNSFTSKQNGSI